MSPTLIKGVKEELPNAEITFHKFHIIKLINKAVSDVRREKAKDKSSLKGQRHASLKNDNNLTAKQKD